MKKIDHKKEAARLWSMRLELIGDGERRGEFSQAEIDRLGDLAELHDKAHWLGVDDAVFGAAAAEFDDGPADSAKRDSAISKKCICADYINHNPDPVANPDCPIHGALRHMSDRLVKSLAEDAGRQADYEARQSLETELRNA